MANTPNMEEEVFGTGYHQRIVLFDLSYLYRINDQEGLER